MRQWHAAFENQLDYPIINTEETKKRERPVSGGNFPVFGF
jgi:hypothetical protein